MPNIVWEGNQKEWNIPHTGEQLKEGAEKIKTSENLFVDSIPYGVPPMVICILAVFLKAFLNREPPIDPFYILPAFIIGMAVALPLHELMHAVCYPKGAVVWVGLCLKKIAAYAVSFHPITRRRYVMMSLAPALLGIIPLFIFAVCPISLKPLLTLCIFPAFTGLISPCPDYMDIISVMRQTEKGDYIQAQNDGLYRIKPKSTER